MRIQAVLNVKGGALLSLPQGDAVAQIERAFRDAGHDVEICAIEGPEVMRRLRRAFDSECDVVVAGGGDGTAGSAANMALQTGKALGVLPLGTLNLFARDLDVPLELPDMAEALARGELRKVDVGQVDRFAFLNHAALGVYPQMIRDRERERKRSGVGKWPAMLHAAIKALRAFPLLDVTLEIDGVERRIRTPSLIASNNPHTPGLLPLLRRERLDSGKLALYLSRHQQRPALIKLAAEALAGRLAEDEDLETILTESFTVRHDRPRLRVALDGELVYLRPPLTFRILPKALTVLAPKAAP